MGEAWAEVQPPEVVALDEGAHDPAATWRVRDISARELLIAALLAQLVWFAFLSYMMILIF